LAHALENDTEGLHRQWKWLRDEDEEAKLNFLLLCPACLCGK